MNRRSLLQGLSFSMLAAKLSGASSLYGQAEEPQARPARKLSANDHIQVGFIGPGSRGQEVNPAITAHARRRYCRAV